MFNAEKVKNECVKWIRDFFEENGKGCNAVIGISGGKDSSIVAALCVEALGRERVIGVLMPNGEQADIDMAQLLVDHLNIKHFIINIKDAVDGVKASLPFEPSALCAFPPVAITSVSQMKIPLRENTLNCSPTLSAL